MTSGVLALAAEQEAAFSVTQLWIIAAGACIAAAVAIGTLPLFSPRTGRRLGAGARVAVALLPPLGGAAFAVLDSTRRGYEESTGLHLYILALLTLVVLRIIFARWLRRAAEQHRSGTPVEKLTVKGHVIFWITFVAVIVPLAVMLSRLPILWA